MAMVAVLMLGSGMTWADVAKQTCEATEYHQFDFWIGDWDVFEAGATKPAAHVKVDRILDGCALHEQYEDIDGQRGESFSSYDAARKQWRQNWYTNRGKSLEIRGNFSNGAMVLTGPGYAGTPDSAVRGTWKALEDAVQETAVISDDGGQTWKPWFDLTFRKRGDALKQERMKILALDAEYQLAVKNNDFAAIDRLLDDGFALISSSGKVFTKADLVAEARNRTATYEIQDDSDQDVRIWGDTAVLTAKLHAKGTESDKPFDYTLVFSDTYVRGPEGWRYVLGQAGHRILHP